ncbi:hypothetical protein [Arcanobacterium urinimassiliense]|uniref:hypothetical protein n=1 Tax=Arcanobacterium urinimassiliense TaxID=1871014 RepID=UPI00093FBDDA|nr:hypothetical protein [Arcanobacterium urinimassiliense]
MMHVWKILTETKITYSMPLFWHFVTLTVTCGLCIGLAISLPLQLWLVKLFLAVIAGLLLLVVCFDLEHFFKAQQQDDTTSVSHVVEALEMECCKCRKAIAIIWTDSVEGHEVYCGDCWKAEREEAKQDRKRILKDKRQEISYLQAALTRKNQEIARLQEDRNEN